MTVVTSGLLLSAGINLLTKEASASSAVSGLTASPVEYLPSASFLITPSVSKKSLVPVAFLT